MKTRMDPVWRLALAMIGGGVLSGFGLYAYMAIPRSLGDIRVDRIAAVSGDVMDRLHEEFIHPEDRPARVLRLDLSSDGDLQARAKDVSTMDSLYAWSGPCPFQEPNGRSATWGPLPDNLPEFYDERAGEVRHAKRQRDGRFRYTVYIDAKGIDAMRHGLCLQIRGLAYFSPRAESGIIVIPQTDIVRALQQTPAGKETTP